MESWFAKSGNHGPNDNVRRRRELMQLLRKHVAADDTDGRFFRELTRNALLQRLQPEGALPPRTGRVELMENRDQPRNLAQPAR